MPQVRTKKSEYGQQLAEKQKIREEYGLRERQFKKYFKKGGTPENVYMLLESRLDSAVFRAGFAPTRKMARQMVSHGHIYINGGKARTPSIQVKKGDKLSVKESSRKKGLFSDYDLRMKNYEAPQWLTVNTSKMEAEIKSAPDIRESVQPMDFQSVIEFYSR